MKKRITLFLIGLFFGLSFINNQTVFAETKQKNNVDVYMFVGDSCPHCKHLEKDIIKYAKNKKHIKLHFYEIYNNSKNQEVVKKVAKKLKVQASGVPFIIIGNQTSLGYGNDITKISKKINYCTKNTCKDDIKNIVKNGVEWKKINKSYKKNTKNQKKDLKKESDIINLPFGFKLNKKTASLPFMTIVIGLLDGFNPCAMWALVFVITLLIGLNDKKKMWSYGMAFIITSAAVYTLFMLAWLSVFNFIGFIKPIRIIIGLVAIGIGGYYLNEYRKKDNVCKISNNEKRMTYFQKMKQSVESSSFWLGLIGVIILAVAVNMVELVCSAGLPAIYTSVISAANLSSLQYAFYIGLYILFFMLDDIIVFAIAVKTMNIVNIDGKYSKISRLVGGVLMLILGGLLIFAPSVIMLN